MKRAYCFILFIILLLCYSVALADQQADTILFRGIEWYQKPGYFVNKMKETGIETKYTSEASTAGSWESPPGVIPSWKYRPVPQFVVEYEEKDEVPICTVAGYNVSHINAYFLAGIDIETNKISYNINDSVFVYGSYTMYSPYQDNPGTLYNTKLDMIKKLSSLYGDYVICESGLLGEETYCWIAKDGSVVSMQIDTFLLGGWSMWLRYEIDAKAYAEKLEKLAMVTDIGNTDGL